MGIGKKIKYFRKKNNLTQKKLGEKLGFQDKIATVRIAQYESKKRTPRNDVLEKLAEAFNVSPRALDVPDVEDEINLMYILFAIEDAYDIEISSSLEKTYISVNQFSSLGHRLEEWESYNTKFKNNEITKEEYDHWRYNYPLEINRD